MCDHRNLHPARIDVNATVCLDCGHQVYVHSFTYANGQTAVEQARLMWERCQQQIRIAEQRPGFKDFDKDD